MFIYIYSRLSRPLFTGHPHHRTPRIVANGPTSISTSSIANVGGCGSSITAASTQGYHNFATTLCPPPEYTTSNPNRCPHNSNSRLLFEPYTTISTTATASTNTAAGGSAISSTTLTNHELSTFSRTAIELTNTYAMKDDDLNETVIDDEDAAVHYRFVSRNLFISIHI